MKKRVDFHGACAPPTTGKKMRLRRFFGIDFHARVLRSKISLAQHHQLMKNPLGWDRILCRGEFGAAVFEQRHSIRSRRAGKVFFGIATGACIVLGILPTHFVAAATTAGVRAVAANQKTQPNPLFTTTLTLPNGKIILPDHSFRWKDISVSLLVTSLPTHSPKYAEIVGNHSTVLSRATIFTSAGTATLVLNKRTPSAASQSTTPRYEYWVIVYGSKYAYCIDATVLGNRNKARNEVLQLSNNWNVPVEITPLTADSKSIAATLTTYLDAFNQGDLAKAYAMFADIKQHMSFTKWKDQGDPQKGWRPVLTRVHVVEKGNVADAYITASIWPPNQGSRSNFVFVYPMTKLGGTWKLVYNEEDFGRQKFLIFQQFNREIEAYASKQRLS